jgi:hypothetical protein
VDMELAASCLEAAIGRSHNQFQILVGEGGEKSKLDFSSDDPLNFEDGTCLVERQLRYKTRSSHGQLLVMTG